MTAVYALRRPIKLSFACTSWRKGRESLNRKEKIMTADERIDSPSITPTLMANQ
jgi:hypothetical protein